MTLPLLGVGPTRTGGGALDPNTISGLTLYLDANDLTTLWQTEDTSTPVAASGDSVGRWLDKSTNGYVCSQSTANERPTWRNDQTGANGRGVIVTPSASGAGSDYLSGNFNSAALPGAVQETIFAVFRTVGPTGSTESIFSDGSGFQFLRWSGATQLRARIWNGTQAQSEANITAAGSTPYIACIRRDSQPHLFLSLNGGTESDVASAGNINLGTVIFATPSAQAALKHNGWIGHILTWNRNLSASERNQVGRWLAGLYGITWTDQ